jgi:hypothetical protein
MDIMRRENGGGFRKHMDFPFTIMLKLCSVLYYYPKELV